MDRRHVILLLPTTMHHGVLSACETHQVSFLIYFSLFLLPDVLLKAN